MKCWLLVATKNMRVAYPPQLFASQQQADFEVQRWLWILFGLKRRGAAHQVTEVVKATPSKAMHLFELPFPEWGRAGANWACLSWEEATYPRMAASLLLCDREDADAWVKQRFRGKGAPKYSLGLPWASEVTFPVRSGTGRAGAYLVQRVM
jgi:hypothetical protein